jgi:uncharacterized membrane protein YqaE (UPF0057 family)
MSWVVVVVVWWRVVVVVASPVGVVLTSGMSRKDVVFNTFLYVVGVGCGEC